MKEEDFRSKLQCRDQTSYKQAGIDISQFKCHSVCKASVTTAARDRVVLSSDSTFRHF